MLDRTPGLPSSGASAGHVLSGSVAALIAPFTPNAISLFVCVLNLLAWA